MDSVLAVVLVSKNGLPVGSISSSSTCLAFKVACLWWIPAGPRGKKNIQKDHSKKITDWIKNVPSLRVASLDAFSTLFLFETVMPVAAALPLELDSAFEDFPVFAMLDFVALSSLILAAFSFCESLSDASSSSTMLRAFFCWCVSWAFLFAWVVWAVLLARRVNVSLRWFFRTPVSSAALISVATFSSTSRALEIVYNYHGIMPQSVKELTWEWLQEANAGYLCWCWSNGVEIRLHLLLVVWGPSLQMTFLRDIWWAMGGSSCCWFCGTTMLRGNFVNFHNYKNEIKPWTLDFGIG